MTAKRDYYEVLGVARTATEDDIRKSFRQAALKYHPDRNPDDPAASEKFKEASEAYAVLSDADKRARYDQLGFAGLGGDGGAGVGDIFSHFQEMFADFFGGDPFGGRARGPRRGADLRVQERLSLKDAVLGCKREVVVRAPSACDTCAGSGSADGKRKTCSHCRGSGQVSTKRGPILFATTCPACHGQGNVVSDPCAKCRGAGVVEKTRKVVVGFPAGIDDGQRLRVPGQGVAGPGGAAAGDLYVDVELEADARFERDGTDLATRVHVSFSDAALGTKVPVELLDGSEIEVDVAAGTQPGTVLSLKGKGVPRIDGRGRGALHVQVNVEVPRRLSARAKELLAELRAELEGA